MFALVATVGLAHFRGHKCWRPVARPLQHIITAADSAPQIREYCAIGPTQKHVVGFDIAVDNALVVHVLQPLQYLTGV